MHGPRTSITARSRHNVNRGSPLIQETQNTWLRGQQPPPPNQQVNTINHQQQFEGPLATTTTTNNQEEATERQGAGGVAVAPPVTTNCTMFSRARTLATQLGTAMPPRKPRKNGGQKGSEGTPRSIAEGHKP